MNPIILYNNLLINGTLTSSALASGYDVQNVKDYRPYTIAKFAAAGSNYIQLDIAISTPVTTLAVCGHNFFTTGAALQLQSWNGTAWVNVTGGSITPANDNAFMLYFTSVSSAKFKLVIINTVGLPFVGSLFIGAALLVEWPPSAPRAPYAEGIVADTEISKSGNLLGSILRYNPNDLSFSFTNLTRTWLKNNFLPFWNYAKTLKPFFFCLDYTTEPENVFYCTVKTEMQYAVQQSNLNYGDVQLTMNGWK